jgi:hypothetical protein
MKVLFPLVCVLVVAAKGPSSSDAEGLSIKDAAVAPADFPLVANGRAATIAVDPVDAEVVRIAAGLFADDVERVTGVKPRVVEAAAFQNRDAPVVLIGTVGQSRVIEDLVNRGKLDVRPIEGKWESFIITTVPDPFAGVARALVIVGSDRRGTAFGVFEASKSIGVSPWVWWADVVPAHRDALVIAGGIHLWGPPSVKYRGIFLNDEDWGLRPWASKTFEPEVGNIGPKTYAKIFELLLRLKANFVWPAMHPGTTAFNFIPENKLVADRYAIVMGSSHAEPMLRDNVEEWPHDKANLWNPVTNLPAIVQYWDERVRQNSRFENVYTVGMRGVHDSGMPGGGTIAEKRNRLEHIIDLQRGLLAKYVNPNPALVPQIFCPYKEVLDIYQAGMHLPDDITIVWPDDNNGYIRQLPTAKERTRSGGHGIYYHLSYWGRPHDYLWLDSTSPALVWHEMTKAYALDARRLWVANVGDLKSNETGMTFFLDMAWNVDHYGTDVQHVFLNDFYTEQFGTEYASDIAAIRDEYYRLCAIRRPEHMGFNRVYPDTPVQDSGWSSQASAEFLDRWRDLAKRSAAIGEKLPARLRNAYFELVEYPACGGAAMAEKILLAEKARQTGSRKFAERAEAAFQRIQALTEEYNATAGGKWRGVMDYRPRNLAVFNLPPTQPGSTPAARASSPIASAALNIDATNFQRRADRDGAGWRVIEGLGPSGHALAVLPQRDTPTMRTARDIASHCPEADFEVPGGTGGIVMLTVAALPTHKLTPDHDTTIALSVGNGDPVVVHFDEGVDDEDNAIWQRNVLRNTMLGTIRLRVPAGAYTVKLWAADPAVVVQRIIVDPVAELGP